MRRLPFLAALALPACSTGSVEVEGDAPAFGAMRSAEWVRMDVFEGEEPSSVLMLSTVDDACGKLDAFWAAYVAYMEAAEAASAETWCADMETSAKDIAGAAADLWREGANQASFSLYGADGADLTGTYPSRGEPMGFEGEFAFGLIESYSSWRDAWDPAGTPDENCGATGSPAPDAASLWSVTGGELEITRFDEGTAVEGTLDASLRDEAGGEAEVTATFHAGWCDISY